MKKSFLSFISLYLLFNVINPTYLKAQGTNYIDFLPLQVGNIWVYRCERNGMPPFCGYCMDRIRVNLSGTNNINGITYFYGQVNAIHIVGTCLSCNGRLLNFASFIRVDTTTANVMEYSTNSGCPYRLNEILCDSLSARLYDSIRYDCQPPTVWNSYVCRDTNNITIFGQSRQHRRYSLQGFESGWGRSYVKEIGLVTSSSSSLNCNSQTQLMGCVINGIVYGDTSFMVGITQISSEIPEKFGLEQNFPNPFNPSTKIRFQIPLSRGVDAEGRRGVLLAVYDILGKEVATLVSEQLSPGTYETEFDGTNYPSGIYYYTLASEDFSQTKKMVLLR